MLHALGILLGVGIVAGIFGYMLTVAISEAMASERAWQDWKDQERANREHLMRACRPWVGADLRGWVKK